MFGPDFDVECPWRAPTLDEEFEALDTPPIPFRGRDTLSRCPDCGVLQTSFGDGYQADAGLVTLCPPGRFTCSGCLASENVRALDVQSAERVRVLVLGPTRKGKKGNPAKAPHHGASRR
jgi:hypothetical protein